MGRGARSHGVRLGDLSAFKSGLRCDVRTRLTIATLARGVQTRSERRERNRNWCGGGN
jgi:hypothetical protein